MMTPLTGLSAIVDRYDLYLLDQFGTLHDGVAPYAGAIPALRGVKEAVKAAVMVSNSGRSGVFNRGRMIRMGFPDEVLPAVITSGDCLQPWMEEVHPARRLRIYATGELDETPLNCVRTDDLLSADLMVINSIPHARPCERSMSVLLDLALERKVPMICTNPDETAMVGAATMRAPGSYAREYQRRGGEVTFIGKPYPLIFSKVLAGYPAVPRDRTVYIGDSLDHDVRGAKAAGIDCLWLLKGVHRAEFAGMGPAARQERALALAEQAGQVPRFFMDELAW